MLKSDIGAGLYRIFLPNGYANHLEKFRVILGKRFDGKLKFSFGGAKDLEDQNLNATITREVKEEFFDNLPATTDNKFSRDNPIF